MKTLFLTVLCAMTILSSAPKAQAFSEEEVAPVVVAGVGAVILVGALFGLRVLTRWSMCREVDRYFEGCPDYLGSLGNEFRVILFQVIKSSFDDEKRAANKVLDYYNDFNFNTLLAVDRLGCVSRDLIKHEQGLRKCLGVPWLNDSTKKKLVSYINKVVEAREFVSSIISAIKDKRVYKEQFDRNEFLRRQEIEDEIRYVEACNDRKVIVQNSPSLDAGVIL